VKVLGDVFTETGGCNGMAPSHFVAAHTQRSLPEKSQKLDIVIAKVVCQTFRFCSVIADSDWLVSQWLPMFRSLE
jgi:hypothetical protein